MSEMSRNLMRRSTTIKLGLTWLDNMQDIRLSVLYDGAANGNGMKIHIGLNIAKTVTVNAASYLTALSDYRTAHGCLVQDVYSVDKHPIDCNQY